MSPSKLKLEFCIFSCMYFQEVDIVVGDVQILANRSENVSFKKPYLTSGLAMLVPVKVSRSGWVPTKAFSLSLWLCILAMVVYYIMLVWFHEVTGEQAVEGFQVRWLNQLGASLWIVCNAIFLNLDKSKRTQLIYTWPCSLRLDYEFHCRTILYIKLGTSNSCTFINFARTLFQEFVFTIQRS